ncbi:hypothetical protein [Eubacterium ramulus]|uniref:DUF7446 family protein n=1 Tax=Eubacterium ramulus TaxID=39490 RepID=UPI00399A655C
MNNNSGKSMGVSPITGTIYCGMLKDDEWVGEKEDVTDMAIRAVFDWFIQKYGEEVHSESGEYQLKFKNTPYVLSMRKEEINE